MSLGLTLTSPAFEDGQRIPAEYTCDLPAGRQARNPPLVMGGVPEGTKSLVLIMADPDIPEAVREAHGIEAFDHWVLYNIPPKTKEIHENTTVGMPGLNSLGNEAYIGPCPPSEYEPREHRYIFTLYALSDTLNFASPPTKQDVLSEIPPLVIQEATLVGRYSRG